MKSNNRNRKQTKEERELGNVFMFKCEMCGEIRPDTYIVVHRIHTFYKWTDSYTTRNVRYCIDKFMCSEELAFFERRYRIKILHDDKVRGREEPEFAIENEI